LPPLLERRGGREFSERGFAPFGPVSRRPPNRTMNALNEVCYGVAYESCMKRKTPSRFEMGPIRPPSEGKDHSLLLRPTRNCPWNRCLFCGTYRGTKFEYRSVPEIKADIDAAEAIRSLIEAHSLRMGYPWSASGGNNRVISSLIEQEELYKDNGGIAPENLVNVANWMASGAKTVFLQDANTLIMRTPELVETLRYLKTKFPSVERITCYARSRTAAQKPLADLKALHEAGLSRIHIGMESGCDEVLEFIQKGVTAREHVEAGRKVIEAGISLSEYVMPGLGGKKWSEKHALETARVLNEIGKPDYIRLRSLAVRRGTPLLDKVASGEFEPLSDEEMVVEIRLLVENLDCSTNLVSDHVANLLWEAEGRLPAEKKDILNVIDHYLGLPNIERLRFKFRRRLLSYLQIYGTLPEELEPVVAEAQEALLSCSTGAAHRVDKAIDALKQGFM